MDLFNLTAPSATLTGAEVMPRVKEEPMAGGNGNPRLQAPHPGSKPSPLSLAPREGASMEMLANAKQQCHPKAVLGKGILVLWEPGLGHVTTTVLGLGHFCRGGSVLPGVGRVKGWETKSCGTLGTHSHTQSHTARLCIPNDFSHHLSPLGSHICAAMVTESLKGFKSPSEQWRISG